MKIRTDFVTNSSSSSFMLSIDIKLKNGKVVHWNGKSDCGEGGYNYTSLSARKGPSELGNAQSITDLINLIESSIGEGLACEGESLKPILSDSSDFIMEIKQLKSVDEIKSISIEGFEESQNGDQASREIVTYDMKAKTQSANYFGLIPGSIEGEGTGGALEFERTSEYSGEDVDNCDEFSPSISAPDNCIIKDENTDVLHSDDDSLYTLHLNIKNQVLEDIFCSYFEKTGITYLTERIFSRYDDDDDDVGNMIDYFFRDMYGDNDCNGFFMTVPQTLSDVIPCLFGTGYRTLFDGYEDVRTSLYAEVNKKLERVNKSFKYIHISCTWPSISKDEQTWVFHYEKGEEPYYGPEDDGSLSKKFHRS